MLLLGADHIAAVAGGDALMFLAIPVLWIFGVIVSVAIKLHSR